LVPLPPKVRVPRPFLVIWSARVRLGLLSPPLGASELTMVEVMARSSPPVTPLLMMKVRVVAALKPYSCRARMPPRISAPALAPVPGL